MSQFSQVLIILFSCFLTGSAQVYNPVTWKNTAVPVSDGVFELRFKANIAAGWHMYGLNIPENGPIATSFAFEENTGIHFLSEISSLEKPEVKYDPTFEMDLELFSHSVTFTRKVQVNTDKEVQVKGVLEFMACDDSRCLPPKEEAFALNLKKTLGTGKSIHTSAERDQPAAESQDSVHTPLSQTINDTSSSQSSEIADTLRVSVPADAKPVSGHTDGRSLLKLFLIAFLAGFGALLTPCVYPIIPLTVSFFMRDTSRSKALFNGLFFGLSIILIYTLVGLLVGISGVDLVRLVSSHWLPNLIFFLVFLALAFSFFGMFEITLPGNLSTSIDKQADKGGFMGPFFMALATVVISFSCTGPIVGVVLGGALQGEIIRPVIGMLGFSISFALPFTLLAIFPGTLKSLPKSGGWLNSVKVFFAFILLAFSLIFLPNMGLSFIDRNAILILGIVIFLLLGLYLLGKIRFGHDNELRHISVPRLLLAIVSLSISIYLMTGLSGKPLKSIEPFLPANEVMLNPAVGLVRHSVPGSFARGLVCSENPKYSEFLKLPLGLSGYFDYDEALACADHLNKPVLLDFAGHYCKNCKKMYAEVWSDPGVTDLLTNNFVVVSLYTDDRTELPEEDWVTSTLDGKVKRTVGKKFNDLQISKFGTNALPLYVIVDSKGNILTKNKYYTYSSSVDGFIHFLRDGLTAFNHKYQTP